MWSASWSEADSGTGRQRSAAQQLTDIESTAPSHPAQPDPATDRHTAERCATDAGASAANPFIHW